MSPDTFFSPLRGQSLLYPGQDEKYKGQCVQSVMLWLKATGTEPPVYPSAYLYYERGIPGYLKVPAGAPILEGDIVIFGTNFPPADGNGHIDVASHPGTIKDYWAWDQNWTPLKLDDIHHNGSDNQFISGYLRKEVMMHDKVTDDFIKGMFKNYWGVDATEADLASWRGTTVLDMEDAFRNSPQNLAWKQKIASSLNGDNLNVEYEPYTGTPLYTKKG